MMYSKSDAGKQRHPILSQEVWVLKGLEPSSTTVWEKQKIWLGTDGSLNAGGSGGKGRSEGSGNDGKEDVPEADELFRDVRECNAEDFAPSEAVHQPKTKYCFKVSLKTTDKQAMLF